MKGLVGENVLPWRVLIQKVEIGKGQSTMELGKVLPQRLLK